MESHLAEEALGKCRDTGNTAKRAGRRDQEPTCPEPPSLKIRPKVEDDTLSSNLEMMLDSPLVFKLTVDTRLVTRPGRVWDSSATSIVSMLCISVSSPTRVGEVACV